MKEKQPVEEELPKQEPIKTVAELYLFTRQKLLNCVDEYEKYQLLLELINIGMTMIDNMDLNERVEAILNSLDDPERYNINYLDSRGVYSCSYGTGDTGKVTVRPEELEIAKNSLRNQQSGRIVQKLMKLDRKIFSELIKTKKIKMMTLEDKIEAEFDL